MVTAPNNPPKNEVRLLVCVVPPDKIRVDVMLCNSHNVGGRHATLNISLRGEMMCDVSRYQCELVLQSGRTGACERCTADAVKRVALETGWVNNKSWSRDLMSTHEPNMVLSS